MHTRSGAPKQGKSQPYVMPVFDSPDYIEHWGNAGRDFGRRFDGNLWLETLGRFCNDLGYRFVLRQFQSEQPAIRGGQFEYTLERCRLDECAPDAFRTVNIRE